VVVLSFSRKRINRSCATSLSGQSLLVNVISRSNVVVLFSFFWIYCYFKWRIQRSDPEISNRSSVLSCGCLSCVVVNVIAYVFGSVFLVLMVVWIRFQGDWCWIELVKSIRVLWFYVLFNRKSAGDFE